MLPSHSVCVPVFVLSFSFGVAGGMEVKVFRGSRLVRSHKKPADFIPPSFMEANTL